jgi:predicted phage tail protein
VQTTEKTALLSWVDKVDNEDEFVVEQSFSETSGFTFLTKVGANTSSTNVTVEPELTYYFRVQSVNKVGKSEFIKTMLTTIKATNTPVEFSVEQMKLGEVQLTWKDNSNNELGYIIERAEGNNAFQKIETTAMNVEKYIDLTIAGDKTYKYQVSSFNSLGNKTSSPISIITISQPAKPTQFVAKQTKVDEVILSWRDNSNNEEKFVIERSDDGGNTFVTVAQPNANATSHVDQLPGQKEFYKYRIKSVNRLSESGWFEYETSIITTVEENISIELYPNPVSSYWIVKTSTMPQYWILTDLIGKEREISPDKSGDDYIFSAEGLSPGIYNLKAVYQSGGVIFLRVAIN